MVKGAPPSKRPKDGSGVYRDHNPTHKGASKAEKALSPKRKQTLAGKILRDIRENAADLSKRADLLLKRVS